MSKKVKSANDQIDDTMKESGVQLVEKKGGSRFRSDLASHLSYASEKLIGEVIQLNEVARHFGLVDTDSICEFESVVNSFDQESDAPVTGAQRASSSYSFHDAVNNAGRVAHRARNNERSRSPGFVLLDHVAPAITLAFCMAHIIRGQDTLSEVFNEAANISEIVWDNTMRVSAERQPYLTSMALQACDLLSNAQSDIFGGDTPEYGERELQDHSFMERLNITLSWVEELTQRVSSLSIQLKVHLESASKLD